MVRHAWVVVVGEMTISWQYVGSMKTKISSTLSRDVPNSNGWLKGRSGNRSGFIEAAVRAYIAQLALEERNAQDLGIINHHVQRLNKEALDVLTYQ